MMEKHVSGRSRSASLSTTCWQPRTPPGWAGQDALPSEGPGLDRSRLAHCAEAGRRVPPPHSLRGAPSPPLPQTQHTPEPAVFTSVRQSCGSRPGHRVQPP